MQSVNLEVVTVPFGEVGKSKPKVLRAEALTGDDFMIEMAFSNECSRVAGGEGVDAMKQNFFGCDTRTIKRRTFADYAQNRYIVVRLAVPVARPYRTK